MTILVVDDSHVNRLAISALMAHEGFRVVEAGDGIEALDVLKREQIDVILSDILMPNMDGYRLCTEVRRSESYGAVPFVFYTGTYTSAGEEAHALELGADKFLRKPAPANLIIQSVRDLISGPRRIYGVVAAQKEHDLTSEYAKRLVEKLEEKNEELSQLTQELGEARDRLQAIVRAAPVAILSIDQAGNVTTWNHAAERIFGWSEAEVLGRRPPYAGVEEEEEFDRLRRRVLGGETIRELEIRRLRRDGTRVDIEMSGAPLHDAEDNIVGSIAVLADITERKRAEARLIKSEALLAEAQAVAHIGSWEWDTRANVVIWSDEMYRMMGLRPQERPVSYPYFLSLVDPGDRDRIDRAVQQALLDHGSYEFEHRITLPNGERRIHHVHAALILDSEGRPARMHGTARDITEESIAREALRQSEQRFAAFMDNLPGFAWMKDLDGKYVYANKVLERLPEYRTGWRGKTDAEIMPAEIAAEYRANDQKVVASGQPIQTVEHYPAEGGTRHLLASKFPIFDQTGAVMMVGGASVDITARVQAEAALRESEERFRQLAENIDQVFWIRKVEPSPLEYVSPAYERIWKRSIKELRVHPGAWLDPIHPEDRAGVRRRAESWTKEGELDETFRIVLPDGSIRWIRDRAFPVRDGQGKLIRIAGIAEDITERKHAAQQVENFAEMLKILTNRLFEMQEEERHHLARELHDEIGQSLTAAKMEIEAAKREEDPEARALRLDDSLAVMQHLLQSVRELSLGLRPALLDEVGLAAALRAHAQAQAARGGLAARLDVDLTLPRCDPAVEIACFRVAQEALTNVLRHAGAKSVEVALGRCGDELRLRVRDDGAGFDVASASARAAAGASFGLVSMRERINLAGGTFLCKSAPGQGAEIEAHFLLAVTRTDYGYEKAARNSGG